MKNARGFTLVEVMVVLVIIAATAAMVSLGFDRLQQDRLEKQASELSSWLQALSDNAVLDSAIYGAWLSADQSRLVAGYYLDGQWWPLVDVDDQALRLQDDIIVLMEDETGWHELTVSGANTNSQEQSPQVIFQPFGSVTPERFMVSEGEPQRSARIERDSDGIFSWQLIR